MKTQLENIKIPILIQAVNEYFYAEEEYQKFLKTLVSGWWLDKNPEQHESYTMHYERSTLHCNTVTMMCKLIGVDIDSVLSMVKAINRWEKHGGKWDRDYCIHICYENERNIKRFLTPKDVWETQYYQSTGRRISA